MWCPLTVLFALFFLLFSHNLRGLEVTLRGRIKHDVKLQSLHFFLIFPQHKNSFSTKMYVLQDFFLFTVDFAQTQKKNTRTQSDDCQSRKCHVKHINNTSCQFILDERKKMSHKTETHEKKIERREMCTPQSPTRD